MFTRRAEADRTDQPAVLRKVATDAFVDERQAHRKQMRAQGGPRRWFGQIGIGAVDTVGLVAGPEFDRAFVKITWSGTRYSEGRNGQPQQLGNISAIRETFVLCRKHGVKSDPGRGIASAHCPSCGRPVSDGLSNACESCGQVLNDGSAGWVLEQVDRFDGQAIQKLWSERSAMVLEDQAAARPAEALPPSNRSLLLWAIKLSLADHVIDAREQRMIEQFARSARVAPDSVATLIAAARAGELNVPEPEGAEETHEWLTAMIRIALADGRMGNREYAWIKAVGNRSGLTDADIRLYAKRETARLTTAARDAGRSAQLR